jgi:hypothetical protein
MRNALIISNDNGMTHFYTCSGCPMGYVDGSEPCNQAAIPIFYSEKHAVDAGWVKTKHVDFCEPGEPFAWVCSDCWPTPAGLKLAGLKKEGLPTTETLENQTKDSEMIVTQITSGGFQTYEEVERLIVMLYVPDMTISRAGISHALGRLKKLYKPSVKFAPEMG